MIQMVCGKHRLHVYDEFLGANCTRHGKYCSIKSHKKYVFCILCVATTWNERFSLLLWEIYVFACREAALCADCKYMSPQTQTQAQQNEYLCCTIFKKNCETDVLDALTRRCRLRRSSSLSSTLSSKYVNFKLIQFTSSHSWSMRRVLSRDCANVWVKCTIGSKYDRVKRKKGIKNGKTALGTIN